MKKEDVVSVPKANNKTREYLDIVFSGTFESGLKFVEVEFPAGTSVGAGEWRKDNNGFWVLRITPMSFIDDDITQ